MMRLFEILISNLNLNFFGLSYSLDLTIIIIIIFVGISRFFLAFLSQQLVTGVVVLSYKVLGTFRDNFLKKLTISDECVDNSFNQTFFL